MLISPFAVSCRPAGVIIAPSSRTPQDRTSVSRYLPGFEHERRDEKERGRVGDEEQGRPVGSDEKAPEVVADQPVVPVRAESSNQVLDDREVDEANAERS